MQTLLEIIQKNNQAETIEYLKKVKIQSAEQRTQFEEQVNQLFLQENNKFEALLRLLLASNELQAKNIFSEIFTKQFLLQNDFQNKELAKKNWQEIPVDLLDEYFMKFQINLKEIQDVHQKIFTLLQNKKAQQAIKLIQLFSSQLDMSPFIDRFIQLDAISDFSKICEQSPNLLKELVSKLAQSEKRNQQKLATDLIKKHDLNKDNYPKLLQIQNRQAIDRIYFPKIEESYERVEERLEGYPLMLRHVIDKLLEYNKVNEAYSIAIRQGLNNEFQLKGTLLENPLLLYDGFGVTEEICFKQDPTEFVLFADFNIKEKNIHFIDTIDELRAIIDQILTSPLTGFDTEFCHYFDEFASGGVAIMQIATELDIFIIDIFNLRQELFLIEFLQQYFSNDKIKIGHSVRNDFNEMARNMNMNQNIQPINIIDLSVLFNEVYENQKNSVSLANQVYQVFGKKLSKKECFSNWQRRPLRKCQLYYSAMDAYICIAMYKKLLEHQGNSQQLLLQTPSQQQQQQQQLLKDQQQIQKSKNLKYHPQYKHLLEDKKDMIFLIDSMLKKLATFLRNLGFDAEYNEKNDHKALENQAIQEGRIIVTRDKKFFDKPQLKAPCFLLSDNLHTEQQFDELQNELQFKVYQEKILTRCVKCNFDHVIFITADQAKKFLDFKNGDSFQEIKEFWQCEKCLQVYWEGNQFKNSVQRFTKVANEENIKK